MAGRRNEDQPDEDLLGDRFVGDDEEEEGEDLFGDNMARDYEDRPELDQYDPDMLDDADHPTLSVEQRHAAERLMSNRERRMQRSPSPGFDVGGSEDEPGSPDERRPKRRRTDMDQSPGRIEAADYMEEEDVPPEQYDLSRENMPMGEVDKRLRNKIQKSFQQFLRKFVIDGKEEPHYPDLLRKMAEDHQMHLDVNFKHLENWAPNLSLWVAEIPVDILPILNEALLDEAERKFETYKNIRATEETELRVAVFGFWVKEHIRDLCTSHLNKLVHVQGVVTKRGNVLNQVKRLYLRCAKCNFMSGPFDVSESSDLKPGSCIECQSKGPWRVDRQKTLYRNHQSVTLQEAPGSVQPGKMPRSKEVILTGDQVDSVRPGDELHLTAKYICRYDAVTNARTCFPVYKTCLESVHVQRRGDVKMIHITDEQTAKILELSKRPNIRESIIASMAPSIFGMWHVKSAIALSMFGGVQRMATGKHRIRGDINVLVVGDPGCAKSQFLKYVEQTFPRAVYTTGKGASAVGLTASVMRDENGDFALHGGAMVLADNGICLIDEFDKMNDQDRTSIHEAMEQQTISISKAGIVATLQARCAVMAVANPVEGRYDPQRSFAQNVNLTDPILSRFDVLCVLRDEANTVHDECLADHVVCSHIRSHPNASEVDKAVKPTRKMATNAHLELLDQDTLQKYIIFARQRCKPAVTDIDKEKLANFYKDIRAEAFRQGGAPMTARHIESIIRLAEANARMELRNHVNQKDLDNAIGLMLESFIQSQKHAVAEELRRKFRKYIVSATPISDQFMRLLERLFRDRAEELRLSRQGGEAPMAKDVPVDMAAVVAQIEREDLDIEEAKNFMRQQRFRQNFKIDEDGKIYQIL